MTISKRTQRWLEERELEKASGIRRWVDRIDGIKVDKHNLPQVMVTLWKGSDCGDAGVLEELVGLTIGDLTKWHDEAIWGPQREREKSVSTYLEKIKTEEEINGAIRVLRKKLKELKNGNSEVN